MVSKLEALQPEVQLTLNGSSNTMVFMAFASHPFGGTGVSPATAR